MSISGPMKKHQIEQVQGWVEEIAVDVDMGGSGEDNGDGLLDKGRRIKGTCRLIYKSVRTCENLLTRDRLPSGEMWAKKRDGHSSKPSK